MTIFRANIAAADPYCTAVALAERFAAFVSFRQQYASFPPTENVNSADASLLPACQFSGNHAVSATIAVTIATSIIFLAIGRVQPMTPYPYPALKSYRPRADLSHTTYYFSSLAAIIAYRNHSPMPDHRTSFSF